MWSAMLNTVLSSGLFSGSGGLELSNLLGSMGDFYDKGSRKDKTLSANRRNVSQGDRIYTSKYRQYWEPYSDDYRDEDEFASDLVDRVLLSATMNDGEDDDFGIARPNDTTGRKPTDYMNQPRRKKVPIETLLKGSKYKKSPNKLERRIRRVKNGQDSVDDAIYVAEEVPTGCSQPSPGMPPGPTICLPLHTYKKMITAEIVAEGRVMQEYYANVIQATLNEKDAALRTQIFWQDRARKMEQECEFYADEARHSRTVNDHLRAQISALKEAKRRRRSAKKQRNRVSGTQSSSCMLEEGNTDTVESGTSDKE